MIPAVLMAIWGWPSSLLHEKNLRVFDENSFDEWVDLAEAPALRASLRLCTLTPADGIQTYSANWRSEYQRNFTQKNLKFSGCSDWERLILRGSSEVGILAASYQSGKRKELEDKGYRIHGSPGDQWSDLMGLASAKQSFKLPNLMDYIP
ncbi:Acid phosphatase, class B-like [Dillenia turbinata]|uniref:Acid phosphatase, class B-like n=1 Tax=Dillenia turbinata TaxID=194707 RepID=A0AAN8W7M7_9MAGN